MFHVLTLKLTRDRYSKSAAAGAAGELE